MQLKLHNLHKRYPRQERDVIDGIDLCVEPGTILVILGLNGCGKTTLMNLMSGFYKPDTGVATLDGKNIYDMPFSERARYISFVSQRLYFTESNLVRDYLSYSFVRHLDVYQKPSKAQMRLVEDYAKEYHIDHILDRYDDQISGGENQIVKICAALIQDTPIMFLDEPTSALDLKNQYKVLNTLVDVVGKKNKTVVLTTHNPNHALFLNAKVALLKDGKIFKYGDARDVVTPDNLKEIYGDSICYSGELGYREVSFQYMEESAYGRD